MLSPIVKTRALQLAQCNHSQLIFLLYLTYREKNLNRFSMAYVTGSVALSLIVVSIFLKYPLLSIIPLITLYCTRQPCTFCSVTTIYDPYCMCMTCSHIFCDSCARTNLIFTWHPIDDWIVADCVNNCKKTAGIKRIRAWVHRMKVKKIMNQQQRLPRDINKIVIKYI